MKFIENMKEFFRKKPEGKPTVLPEELIILGNNDYELVLPGHVSKDGKFVKIKR